MATGKHFPPPYDRTSVIFSDVMEMYCHYFKRYDSNLVLYKLTGFTGFLSSSVNEFSIPSL